MNMDSIIDEALDEEDLTEDQEKDIKEKHDKITENVDTDKGTSMEEINSYIDNIQKNISVIGCGGGGCNTINRIYDEQIDGAELIAVNTDAQDLKESKSNIPLLIGPEICNGQGAGSVPRKGEEAARESIDEIENLVKDQDMVFITAGMGGGTGTGAAPVVAEVASEYALTISIVTIPFTAEGASRMNNAKAGLNNLRKHSDTVIVIPNDKLLEFAPNISIQKAFKICDEVLMRSVKGITDLITQPNLVNLDFADVKTIMGGGGVAMIGLGESNSQNKAVDSVSDALNSPLIDVNIDNASNILVNVSGGENMQIEEAQGVVQHINNQVSDDARIIWGAGVDEEKDNEIHTMIVITGVESPQMFGDEPDENEEEVFENEPVITDDSSDTAKQIDYVR